MENNEIMEKLMQSDIHSDTNKDNRSSTKEAKNEHKIVLSDIRVVTAKYKVRIVILLILCCILCLNWIPKANDLYDSNKKLLTQKGNELTAIWDKITLAEGNMQFLTWIIFNESNIVKCINEWDTQKCDQLPKEWYNNEDNSIEDGKNNEGSEENTDNKHNIDSYNLYIPVSYLQMHSLYNKKMDVDEKAILKNLNEHLIRQDITDESGAGKSVGKILKINIWDPEVIWYKVRKDPNNPNKNIEKANLYSVSVDVEIEFKAIWDLIDFLYNVEKKIIDTPEDRILYKIQSVSYDIIANDEPQITDISMIAYYYYDNDFEWMNEYDKYFGENKEEVNEERETDDKQSSNEEKVVQSDDKSSSNSQSFLDKIFNF